MLNAEGGYAIIGGTFSGTSSVQSSTILTGGFSLRTNPTTTGTSYVGVGALSSAGADTTFSVGTEYVSFNFRVDTLPVSLSESFFGPRHLAIVESSN